MRKLLIGLSLLVESLQHLVCRHPSFGEYLGYLITEAGDVRDVRSQEQSAVSQICHRKDVSLP